MLTEQASSDSDVVLDKLLQKPDAETTVNTKPTNSSASKIDIKIDERDQGV